MTTTLITPTPDAAASERFYTSVGFRPLGEGWFADVGLTVRVDPIRTARTALVLHGPVTAELVEALSAFGRVVEQGERRVARDPNGVLLVLDPTDAPAVPDDLGPSVLGPFVGLSIESVDPVRTTAFWEAAGWSRTKGDPGQGWVTLEREGCIGLSVLGFGMCPHLFPNPGLTYFNHGQNPAVIAELRKRGVPFAEEITVFNEQGEVDNVILCDPGGTGFLVFND